jgi:hypothetical protein
VLLVTAGWAEHEHDELHVKQKLNELGVPSRFENGFDRGIQNLSLRGELGDLLRAAPELSTVWAELRRVVTTARTFYLEHNAHLIALARRAVENARAVDPSVSLARLADGRSDGAADLMRFALGRELGQALATLEANDDHLVTLLRDVEQRTFDDAGIAYDPAWRITRARLEERILSANTVVIFGGRLDLLLDALRFFRLRDVLAEALRRGTQIVAMSAGAMVLCERVIVYDDLATTPRDFQLYDRGLGLVRELQLFPHCMERIQTDDPDNLAYLARRFRHHVCVGLNQRSFLLLEYAPARATSVGTADGVYVFDQGGQKACYRRAEALPLAPF